MDPQRIVFAAAEMTPYAKVGGLADVLGSLPAALAARGHTVSVILPLYKQINAKAAKLRKAPKLEPIDVPWGTGPERITIKTAKQPGAGVTVYFVEHADCFGRDGIYTDPTTKTEYDDNAQRWAFFARAVCETTIALGLRPDILHVNDFQSALVPAYLRTLYAGHEAFARTASVLSLHNLGYQGTYKSGVLRTSGLPEELCDPLGPFEFFGHVNLLKGGVWFADMLTTVSPRYAEEIQTTDEFGAGLEGLLRARGHSLVGIVNGVDYGVWDPRTDTHLPATYGPEDLSGKWTCKAELVRRMGLPAERTMRPVIGMVTRLVYQKGIDLLRDAAERLLSADVSLVVLGSGAPGYQEFLTDLAARHPTKVAAEFGFHDDLAHLIEAGSDFFLMPSKYEPCGLNQMYSLRYGTIPIVRETGGLADTIVEWNGDTGDGTGFLFEPYTPDALLDAVWRALHAYEYPAARERLMLNGMAQDFSWNAAAARYEHVYQWAHERRAAPAAAGGEE